MAIGAVKNSRVTILNLQGLKLVGELDDVAGSTDLCILCHGFRSTKQDPTLLSLSKALTGVVGLSTYRFDFTGNGESVGEFAYGSYWREAGDIQSVVNYFRFRGWRIVSAIGHSKGSNAVLLYASKLWRYRKHHPNVCTIRLDHRVSAAIDLLAFSPGMGKRLGGEKGVQKLKDEGVLDVFNRSGKFEFRVLKSDLEERFATDMYKACLGIPEHCRVLNIHGSVDETVPTAEVYEFGKRIPNSTVHIIDGADHNFKLRQDQLAKLVVDFVQACPKQPQLRASL